MHRSVRTTVLLAAAALVALPMAAPRSAPVTAAESQTAKTPKQAPCAVCSVREGAGDEPVRATAIYEGKTYYFCQEGCREEFLKHPGEFVSAQSKIQNPKSKIQKPGATAVPT